MQWRSLGAQRVNYNNWASEKSLLYRLHAAGVTRKGTMRALVFLLIYQKRRNAGLNTHDARQGRAKCNQKMPFRASSESSAAFHAGFRRTNERQR